MGKGGSGYIPLEIKSHLYKGGKVATIIKDTDLIKDTDFKEIAQSVKPDLKKRVVLPKALVREGVTYHIYHNGTGQIMLDPQITIPASEAWLYNNPDTIASVRRGLGDAALGRVKTVDLTSL